MRCGIWWGFWGGGRGAEGNRRNIQHFPRKTRDGFAATSNIQLPMTCRLVPDVWRFACVLECGAAAPLWDGPPKAAEHRDGGVRDKGRQETWASSRTPKRKRSTVRFRQAWWDNWMLDVGC
jgi:hypothetical protein